MTLGQFRVSFTSRPRVWLRSTAFVVAPRSPQSARRVGCATLGRGFCSHTWRSIPWLPSWVRIASPVPLSSCAWFHVQMRRTWRRWPWWFHVEFLSSPRFDWRGCRPIVGFNPTRLKGETIRTPLTSSTWGSDRTEGEGVRKRERRNSPRRKSTRWEKKRCVTQGREPHPIQEDIPTTN